MKGLFLPEITTEDFREGCLESIEALIGEGKIYDIDYPEPCEDCISREKMLEMVNTKTGYVCPVDVLSIPTVQPKVKTGHWIYDKDIHNWRCSRCNETPGPFGYTGSAGFMEDHFKFCNHCGADMTGDDTND